MSVVRGGGELPFKLVHHMYQGGLSFQFNNFDISTCSRFMYF